MPEQNLSSGVMYHFSDRVGWEGVTQGNPDYSYEDPRTGNIVDGKEAKGLWPSRRLIPLGIESALVPREATRPAVFGLPEERPSSWIEYEDSTKIFDYLLRCCVRGWRGYEERVLVLLRVDLKPEDHPFVVDYVHLRKMGKEISTEASLKRQQQMIAEGNRRYWESRVSLLLSRN